MSDLATFHYKTSAGNSAVGEVSLKDHELAHRLGMRLSQVINAKYPDSDPALGNTFQQGLRSAGIFPKGNKEFGIPSTTFADAMSGACAMNSGLAQLQVQLAGNSIVAPSTPVGGSTPASRLFLPEVILGLIEENLQEDYDDESMAFQAMIADDFSIAGPIYTQPTINTEAPKQHDPRPIAQNALPRNLISISASQSSKSIATESVGLQIADQAVQLATLNLVQIILGQQMLGYKYRMLWSELSKIVTGNADAGEGALTAASFKTTYDTAAAAGEITHKGWIKVLYDPTRKVRLDTMICTLDDVLAIQNRTGRPVMFDPRTSGQNTGNAGSYGIDVTMTSPLNLPALGISKILIVPDGVLGASQRVLLFDSRYALRRVTNALASYSAVEQMVLQRSTFFRTDFGFLLHRLMDSAFLLLDYS